MNYVGNPPATSGLVLVGDASPIGMIGYFHQPPDASWKQLNGQTLSKTAFPDLWAYAQLFLTADQTLNPGLYRNVDASNFAVPKLDGLFIRSTGANGTNVAGALGALQAEDFKSHVHVQSGSNFTGAGGFPPYTGSPNTPVATPYSTQATGGAETRPINAALVPCVKAMKTILIPSTSLPVPPVNGPGRVLQLVSHLRGDTATTVATIPIDDSIPQITEGTEFFNLVITPQQVGSRIRLSLQACGSTPVPNTSSAALFLVGQANALAAWSLSNAAEYMGSLIIQFDYTTLSLTPLNFTARIASSNGGLWRMNGNSGSRMFGGVAPSYFKAEEYST